MAKLTQLQKGKLSILQNMANRSEKEIADSLIENEPISPQAVALNRYIYRKIKSVTRRK